MLCLVAFGLVLIVMVNGAPAMTDTSKVLGCNGKPADVFFLLDSSSSIWIIDHKKQLKFVAELVESFEISDDKTRIAAASFSDKFALEFQFGDYNGTDGLKTKIEEISYLTGGTKTHIALRRMRESFAKHARKNVAHIAVVLTDGQSENFHETVTQAQLLHKAGVYVFAVGIGRTISRRMLKELNAIGSNPDEEFVFKVASFDMLNTIRETLAYSACKVKIPTTTTPFPQMDQPQCFAKAETDVVFTLDATSMGKEKTFSIYNFIGEIIDEIFTTDGKVQAGVMSKNCYDNDIKLDAYKDKNELMMTLRNIEYKGLDHQIRKLRHNSFSTENGGRQSAKKIAVLFVDDSIEKYDPLLLEAEKAKLQEGIELFVVAIGDKVNYAACGVMASDPVGDHVIKVSSHRDLKLLKDDFLFSFCKGL